MGQIQRLNLKCSFEKRHLFRDKNLFRRRERVKKEETEVKIVKANEEKNSSSYSFFISKQLSLSLY
jgi:hypothetical protein